MKRVTRKDIAREAEVTETIVSYVMNGNRYVDKAKKKRVLEAVRKLGYVPSPMARALKGKTSNHILFIADDMVSEHFGSIIAEMHKRASRNGMLISLVSDRGDPDFVSTVLNWMFDGIVIGSSTISNKDIQTLINIGIPVVLLAIKDYPVFNGNYGLINTGLRRGTEEVVEKFYQSGRKKVAYACYTRKENRLPEENDYRYIGYRNASRGENILVEGAYDAQTMEENVQALYRETRFDALLARTDNTALVVISALKSIGVRIPEDVSVVGFNNSSMCAYTSPTLSSVKIKRDEIAKSAMQLLQIIRKGEKKGVVISELTTEVIERDSFRSR